MSKPNEIWFDRFLGSYMPCHWKGLLALVLMVALTMSAIFAAEYLLVEAGREDLKDWSFLLIFLGWVWMMLLARKHSR